MVTFQNRYLVKDGLRSICTVLARLISAVEQRLPEELHLSSRVRDLSELGESF